jgi:hypothetical protein
VSSRRESPAVPPTRDAQERCVGCALSGALRTREGNGTDTPLGRDSAQSGRTDAVTSHRARGPRESRARAARRTRGRRTAARTTVFVLAFHDRLIVGVLYTWQHIRQLATARASHGRTDATQNTTHWFTIAIRTSEPSRTTSHATHREWPHAPTQHEPTHASTHSAVPHGPHSLAHNAHHHWHKEVRRERRCRDLPR